MALEDAYRDEGGAPTLIAVGDGDDEVYRLLVDPITKRLKVDALGASSVDIGVGEEPAYSVAGMWTLPLGKGIVAVLEEPDAGKEIYVTDLRFGMVRNGGDYHNITTIQRRAVTSGGTYTTQTPQPHDSTETSSSTALRLYTVLPALGTEKDPIWQGHSWVPTLDDHNSPYPAVQMRWCPEVAKPVRIINGEALIVSVEYSTLAAVVGCITIQFIERTI